MKKKFYLVLDTETATLPFANELCETPAQKKKLAIARPLVYDIGWTIIDRAGKIQKTENFLIQETFFVPSVFNTAYYRKKRPAYMKLLKEGRIQTANWAQALAVLYEDLKTVDIASAYNAAFDFKKAIPFTCEYIDHLYSEDYNNWEWGQKQVALRIIGGRKWNGQNEDFLKPFFHCIDTDFPICDLWDLACERLINIDKYRDYCLSNNLLTNSAMYFKTSAEVAYRYLAKQYQFEETHIALDDATIESMILAKALKRGKVEPTMGSFPFQKLGTTVDYVMEKRHKFATTLAEALANYLAECECGDRYYNRIANERSRLFVIM